MCLGIERELPSLNLSLASATVSVAKVWKREIEKSAIIPGESRNSNAPKANPQAVAEGQEHKKTKKTGKALKAASKALQMQKLSIDKNENKYDVKDDIVDDDLSDILPIVQGKF